METWQIGLLSFSWIFMTIAAVGLVTAKIYQLQFGPFKSKQLNLLLLNLISAICYVLGLNQSLGVIPQVGIFADW
jgi:hypothetical protein